MSDQPLQPFAPPSAVFSHLPNAVSAGTVIEWFVIGVFVLWAVYTLVAVYHWLKYSHGSLMAYPAIGVHLGISVLLMAFALSGAFF